jgi:hypothetical protein
MAESTAVPQAERTARQLSADEPTLYGALNEAHDAVARYLERRSTATHPPLSPDEARRFPEEQTAIRVAVARLVGILRERGVMPERVLITLKDLLASMPRCDGHVEHDLRDQVIGWAIEAYYR